MYEIKNLYLTILLISVLVGLRDILNSPLTIKLIWSFVLLSLVVELIGFYTLDKSAGKQVNINIYKLYLLIECIILGFYFYLLLDNWQKLVIFSFILLFLVEIFIFRANLVSFHQTYLISIFFKFSFSIIYLKECLNLENEIFDNPHFWIVTGILFFNSGFFFLSGFINVISTKNADLARKLFSINHILNIIYYSLITYGFICQRRLAKSSL